MLRHQIYYDSSRVEGAQLPEDSRICIRDNGEVTAGTFDAETALSGVLDLPQLKYSVDLAFFDCAHPSLPEVALDQPGAIDASDPNDQEAITKLCGAEGTGVNAEAYSPYWR